jgi:hypothetical protein
MSNSRRLRRHLASRDGEMFTVRACCSIDVVLGVGRVNAQHDNGCPALDPSTTAGVLARIDANAAIAAACTARGLPSFAVVIL